MGDHLTRRKVLSGAACGAASLLFSRKISPAQTPGSRQASPAIGNAHLLTLVALNPKTLRLRVVQAGKQGPANEVGIVAREWPEPLEQGDAGLVRWGDYKVHLEERPWRVTISDAAAKTRQQLRLEPSTGAILFSLGEGPLFGLGEGVHPFNRRGTSDAMRNGQHSPELATYGARVPIPWLMGAGCWGIFFAHPWGSFDLTGDEGRFLPTEETPTRDIFVVLADTPVELLREWAELTG